jgi:hypothetical protein
LLAVDTSGDIEELASFLQREAFNALGRLGDYNSGVGIVVFQTKRKY